MREVTFEEWKQLLGAILSESSYETIVLDVGESVQGLMEILHFCDKIYMPILEDSISIQKIRQYEEGLMRIGLEEILKKTYKFTAVADMSTYAKKLMREEK